jgi:hypothetical protein
VTVDATQAWDLATPAPARPAAPRLDTDAGTILWLAPTWERPDTWRPALEAYIELTQPEDDCCLVLQTSGTSDVAAAVARACEDIAGDSDFGDILLVDARINRPEHAHPVDGHATIAAAIGHS